MGVGLLAGSIISRLGLFGLGQIVRRWQAAHDAFIARRTWLQPLSGRVYICAACLTVIFAAALNYDVRQRQFAVWKANPHITHLDDMPLFSTADAPYFMRIAANLKRHDSARAVSPGKISPGTALHGRAPPDPQITPQITPQTGLHEIDLQARPQATDNDEEFNRWQDAPLLSAVIAVLAKDDSRAEIAKAGHLLIPVSAALTVIMVAFTFGMAGYWLEGAVAALGGGLSFSYLSRSAAGRIDTDQLNLGFFYLLFGLALFAGTRHGRLPFIIGVLVMAAAAYLFNWWYGKPELIVMPVIAFIWLRLIVRRDWRGALAGAVIVVMLSGISVPNIMASSYIQPHYDISGFQFPNAIGMVSEVQSFDISHIFLWVTGHIWLGWFCVLGLLLLAFRHPVIAIAYAPLAGFMLLNLVLGNRAIFYAAPACWFGGAWLFITLCRAMLVRTMPAFAGLHQQKAGIVAAGMMFLAAYQVSPTDYIPQPSFPKPVMSAFAMLADRVDEPFVASWWDYGHASRFLNGQPALHDGGGAKVGVTHFFARALATDDLQETAAILRFLVRDGRHLLGWYRGDADGLYQLIKAREPRSTRPIFLVLTGEMAGWMQAIHKIASWDIQHGKWQPDQFHFADSSYVKLFLYGQTGDGRFELVHDDYPHVRIFRLSDRAPVT